LKIKKDNQKGVSKLDTTLRYRRFKKMKNEMVKLGFVLFLIAAIAAGILSVSNLITSDLIAMAEEAASSGPEVAGAVISGGVKFENIDTDLIENISSKNEKFVDAKKVLDKDGNEIGYAVRTLSVMPGYGGDMELYVGISSDGEIAGIKVLSLQETPGLGTNVEKKDFQDQYIGKASDSVLQTVKTPPSNDSEISALAGATFSSMSFTSAINNATSIYNSYLKEGAEIGNDEDKELTEADIANMLVASGNSFEEIDSAIIDTIKAGNNKFVDAMVVLDESGAEIGYAVRTLSKIAGYGGNIEISVGIDKNNIITGIIVESMNETPGFGSKVADDEFKSQFLNKGIEDEFKIVLGNAFADNEIDSLAGATMSSNSFASAVNNALEIYKEYLK
jgi:electron transport complex protein RnfG